jgi:hypothetical protein
MTRAKKLDAILHKLMYLSIKTYKNEPTSKPITMEFLCSSMDDKSEDWEMASLKDELLGDRHIVEKSNQIYITEDGNEFMRGAGAGYANKQKAQEENDVIRRGTIKGFKMQKWAFWATLIGLLIAALTLIFS